MLYNFGSPKQDSTNSSKKIMVKRKTLDLSLSLFCKAIIFATYKTLLNVQ